MVFCPDNPAGEQNPNFCQVKLPSIIGVVVSYKIPILVTRVRFPDDAFYFAPIYKTKKNFSGFCILIFSKNLAFLHNLQHSTNVI
jgi:hypothetical protein